MSNYIPFKTEAGFCLDCGSILPLPVLEAVDCYACKKRWSTEMVYKNVKSTFKLDIYNETTYEEPSKDDENEPDGPILERKCPRCGNNRMSYATLQLRSSDEGQTVFYTCTNCKFKERENS